MTRRLLAGLVLLTAACSREPQPTPGERPATRPSILLVTLDTTRADAIGPEAVGVETPAFDALAQRGLVFRQAYATVPETLPSHASMLTGLYPAGHGVHENARHLAGLHPLAAERLRAVGYRTEAYVSSFALARRFGLARGFDVYDDELPAGRAERNARETTERVLARLAQPLPQPLLLWVHYYDPHHPYTPPEPFRSRYADKPYLGEVAAMDEQLGRLVQAFEQRAPGPVAVVVAGDHGEGLGDHGEALHGHLAYQSTMRVPLLLVGPGVGPGTSDTPVSARQVFHTLLNWAGLGATDSLLHPRPQVVLGEAMKPFLSYGWQPQVLAVEGRLKAISAGKLEVYDVQADPGEKRDLSASESLSQEARRALREYPLPSPAAPPARETLGDEERRQLASLGYVSAGAAPVVRKDAPRPADMADLLALLDRASGLFVEERYAQVLPLLERILSRDPGNLDAVLRLATAHSALGHDKQALATFQRARELAPASQDVRAYLGLHYVRTRQWSEATPLLERVVAEAPERLPALEGLALAREGQGRPAEALDLRRRAYALRPPSGAECAHVGLLAMATRQTGLALEWLERARALQGPAFHHDLELGVLYLVARRYDQARQALDRVPPGHPDAPMALFKRAQVSVLLNEPDQTARIETARRRADASTRELIARERLFQGAPRP